MPIQAVLCRPRRVPKCFTALSESHPPIGDITVIAMNGVVPHKPPLGRSARARE